MGQTRGEWMSLLNTGTVISCQRTSQVGVKEGSFRRPRENHLRPEMAETMNNFQSTLTQAVCDGLEGKDQL